MVWQLRNHEVKWYYYCKAKINLCNNCPAIIQLREGDINSRQKWLTLTNLLSIQQGNDIQGTNSNSNSHPKIRPIFSACIVHVGRPC